MADSRFGVRAYHEHNLCRNEHCPVRKEGGDPRHCSIGHQALSAGRDLVPAALVLASCNKPKNARRASLFGKSSRTSRTRALVNTASDSYSDQRSTCADIQREKRLLNFFWLTKQHVTVHSFMVCSDDREPSPGRKKIGPGQLIQGRVSLRLLSVWS